jgi:alkylhydroperoxidase family enzyme
MANPRISYVDPATIKDAAMLAEFDRCAREGTPRPESQAVRAHVPAVFWSFANSWRDVFKNGVADHAIKELCRIYVSRSVLCEFCGNQRSIKAAKQGVVEEDYRDLINFESSTRYDERQKAALSYAEAITWDLPVDTPAQTFQRAGAGRDRVFHRLDHGAAALAAPARYRAPPGSLRDGRLHGAGLRE